MSCDPQVAREVISMASTLAAEWFHLQQESGVPDLDPDDTCWTMLNERYPENARLSASNTTPLDRLFESAFRAEMARLWQREAECAVRRLLMKGA